MKLKNLIFDTGPIISLATNSLLFILEKLNHSCSCNFFITEAIKREGIERPLESKKFKFEALRVLKLVQNGTLRIYSKDLRTETEKILNLANNIYLAKGNYIQIVHYGEIEVVAAALDSNADAIVIDERTTRVLIENPMKVKERLEKKLHTHIEVNHDNLKELRKIIGHLNVIRSFELVAIAYEKGILDDFVLNIDKPRKELLESVLWGVKLSGCSVSEDEINSVLKIEKT